MGWASGSELAEKLWAVVRPHLDKATRRKVGRKFAELFEDFDCDVMEECEVLMKDIKP